MNIRMEINEEVFVNLKEEVNVGLNPECNMYNEK